MSVTEEQSPTCSVLRQVEGGAAVPDACPQMGVSTVGTAVDRAISAAARLARHLKPNEYARPRQKAPTAEALLPSVRCPFRAPRPSTQSA